MSGAAANSSDVHDQSIDGEEHPVGSRTPSQTLVARGSLPSAIGTHDSHVTASGHIVVSDVDTDASPATEPCSDDAAVQGSAGEAMPKQSAEPVTSEALPLAESEAQGADTGEQPNQAPCSTPVVARTGPALSLDGAENAANVQGQAVNHAVSVGSRSNEHTTPDARRHLVGDTYLAGDRNVAPPPAASPSVHSFQRTSYDTAPCTVMEGGSEGAFRRGCDNSHVNRMVEGSYSRYLLSSDMIPPSAFYSSFYGDQTVPGAQPIGAPPSGQPTEIVREIKRREAMLADARHSHSRSRSPRDTTFNRTEKSWASGTMGTAYSSILGGATSSVLRREHALLDEQTCRLLATQRNNRRRHPRQNAPDEERDFFYYNHKSKGCFFPREQHPDTLALHYNHLYDFGNGTRFASIGPPRLNPTARPPTSFAQSRGASYRRGQTYSGHIKGGDTQNALVTNPGVLRREWITKKTNSLRSATALNWKELHCSQFRTTPTIEHVMATNSTTLSTRREGETTTGAHNEKGEWGRAPHTFCKAAAMYDQRPVRSGAASLHPVSCGKALTFTDRPSLGLLGVVGSARQAAEVDRDGDGGTRPPSRHASRN